MTVQEMLEAHPQAATGDRAAIARCVEACLECAATCTICADADLAEADAAEMARCIRLDLDCTGACIATAGVAARQTERDPAVLRASLQACLAACRACADECE